MYEGLPLGQGWALARLPAGAVMDPAGLPADLSWIAATVPGTAAAALQAAGLWREAAPEPLHGDDIWYRGTVLHDGLHRLTFAGLATMAEVWLDGAPILQSESMFVAQSVEATLRAGSLVHLRFRSLHKALSGRRGRARWRPRLATPATLRFARTTLLGNMPGWCPEIHAVGPWRAITAVPLNETPRLIDIHLQPTLEEENVGRLRVRLAFSAPLPVSAAARLLVNGRSAPLALSSPQVLDGEIRLDPIEPWWPHTHGSPRLYDVEAEVAGETLMLGEVGFRRLDVRRGPDGEGFALAVNGTEIFCRGASWTSADLVGLSDAAATYEPWLRLACEGGMNMLRVTGLGVYEGDAFYALCDRLGLLVWQDFMFANFDYPSGDAGFVASATREAEQFLTRTGGRACLATFCGGSEIDQQAAMLGVPEAARGNVLFDTVLPDAVSRLRPDVPYIPHTPWGSPLPFLPGAGVTHYYGVGAYLRPLDDARRSRVRFASECLALANVPDSWTVSRALGVSQTHDPRWKAAVPRDVGASWDFEDVREHYLKLLFEVEPLRLRYEEPERYLELSRAVSAHLIAQTFSEWRRAGSGCGGGLIFQFQDLRPGAGWGVVDSLGRPKAAWHGLSQVAQPVQLLVTDEGLNGLGLHIVNDGALPLDAALQIVCLRNGQDRVTGGDRAVSVPAHGGISLASASLLPAFFDITYAYRFGPPAHDVVVARLVAGDGSIIDESFYFPRRLALPLADLGLHCVPLRDDRGWFVVVNCRRVSQFVHIDDANFRAEREWIHLAPGRDYKFRLIATNDGDHVPDGELIAINGVAGVHYCARATDVMTEERTG